MISCVAVSITLLLLSVVDVWKLKCGLAPYSLTAGVGALTLAIIFKKSQMAQTLMPGNTRHVSSSSKIQMLMVFIESRANLGGCG